ncbi:MAG: phosphate ABC transporter ATP-binding protein [Oscillospiraceae bacterium]|nr:phosphate ABC transporter ATP-binding protein [Oscillospiraceae bacterium]
MDEKTTPETAVKITGFNAYYGHNQALKSINLDIPENQIYAFIGPSGCGKTTMLRSINRLNDLVSSFRREGEIEVFGTDVYSFRGKKDVLELRMGIGMVFQQPNPLPTTVMKNMLLPVKEHYKDKHSEMVELAVRNLKNAGLFEEVEDRLNKAAMKLSGGQQQRLCIARALMLNPKILLFDEPCSALDPVSTYKIEDLLMKLKENYTIIMVTHNMEQAARISDRTAFFYQGEIVESNTTYNLFTVPENELTQKYVMRKM